MIRRVNRIAWIMLLAALGFTAAAQTYSIRVEFNTNIRTEPSLNGARLETVPAGTIMEVLQEYNRWLRVNRGGEAWMASWVSHERVETPAGTAELIDNCCGVDRQCHADHEWEAGYWAFQNGECQAPVTSVQSQAPQQQPASQASDNCCGIDRQCATDQEWIDGYWAYQNRLCGAAAEVKQSGVDNCCSTGWSCQREHEFIYGHWAAQHNRCFPTPGSPPPLSYGSYIDQGHIRITELTPGFTTMVNAGFELLRTHTPQWYNYVVNAILEYRETHCCGTGVYGASGIVVYHHAPHSVRPYIRQDDYTMAENMVHEACHVYQDREGRGVGGALSWLNEYECELYARDAAFGMGGVSLNIGPDSVFLNDPMNRALWWWNP